MATIDLGKIKLVNKNTWDTNATYTADDIVQYTDNGILSTYICVVTSSQGHTPSSSGTTHASWNFLAKGIADPIPTQSNNSGKFLTTNGSAASWGAPASGDFEKIAVATGAGGSGDLIFDNLDVTTFKTFDLTLMCKPTSDAAQLRFKYRSGGGSGSTIATNHHQTAFLYMSNSNNIASSTTMGGSAFFITNGVGNGNQQEGLSLNMRISMCDANDNGDTKQRMNTVWWSVMSHNESLMPEWQMGNGTITSSSNNQGGGTNGTTDYPTGFLLQFTSGNVGNFSYQLYGLKR